MPSEAARRRGAAGRGADVAGERIGLARRADGDDLVGVEVGQRRAAEEVVHRLAHERHARRAPDQDDAVDIVARGLGVADDGAHGGNRAVDEWPRDRLELAALDRLLDPSAADRAAEDGADLGRKRLLGCARGDDGGAPGAGAFGGDAGTRAPIRRAPRRCRRRRAPSRRRWRRPRRRPWSCAGARCRRFRRRDRRRRKAPRSRCRGRRRSTPRSAR